MLSRRELLLSTSSLLLSPSGSLSQQTSNDTTDIPISQGFGAARPGFDKTIQQFLQETGAPGCSFVIVRNNRITYSRGYGYADASTREPFTPKTLSRIASLTKTLTSFTILRLVEQGKLSLADKAFSLLGTMPFPEDGSVDPRLNNVTVEQCLNMTGGWSRTKAIFNRGERAIQRVYDISAI